MNPTVTILMATRDGAEHLPAQLASLAAQTHRDWRLWVSDDGSRDGTREMVAAFAAAHPMREVRLIEGPRQGSAANFLSALCHPDLPPGPVALCDQDDVWLKGKLARALRRLAGTGGPALYAAESWYWHPVRGRRRASRPPSVAPGFANALVQNLCAGHTTVLNAEALALVRRVGVPRNIAFHDWWLYQLVTGAGGTCRLDPLPVALYRQHGGNLLGAGGTAAALARRVCALMRGDFARWLGAHHRALAATGCLTPGAQATVAQMLAARNRAWTMARLGLRRDRRVGTAALLCAAVLGRA
jgi:glycosyltransferase involved in cell wall biosynthesis